ncbi:MAG TPA: CvpA family protein [Peptococcaceae bacterium]|nr:CvpA family protein [Peptococcaceae bacterium]
MNTFDYAVLGLLAFGGLVGFQKGLFTGLAKFFGNLAALVLAVVFHTDFLQIMEPVLDLRALIEPKIGSFLTSILAKYASTNIAEDITEPLLAEATVLVTNYVLKIAAFLVVFIAVTILINLLISLIVTPLAKNLSLLNRGVGFLFGSLSMLIGLCLIIGLIAPFITAADLFNTGTSKLFPWLWQGYEFLRAVIAVWAGDIFQNPLETIPAFTGTFL